MRELDLRGMTAASGRRYEDVYGAWLDIFKEIAESKEPINVRFLPYSWVPLVEYLGGNWGDEREVFPEDRLLKDVDLERLVARAWKECRLRELAETFAAMRPELVDSLYKADMEWDTKATRHQWRREFVMPNNSSFFRPEIKAYLAWLRANRRQNKPNALLVPCAADKPYPAPMHEAVIKLLEEEGKRDKYEVIVVSGALGVCPEWAWSEMPLYDAGMPNPQRVYDEVREHFSNTCFDEVVVYSDYNADMILNALKAAGHHAQFPLPFDVKGRYSNLMAPQMLMRLSEVL